MIEVIRPGLLTSVQDLGRTGYRHLGVSSGGALDDLALMLANRLVGNPGQAAGLEIVLGLPVRLRFCSDSVIALTGADVEAEVDGESVWPGWRMPVSAGMELNIGRARSGALAYLAVAGGIDVPQVLGGCGTDMSAGFGGFCGRRLLAGDRLPIGLAPAPRAPFGIRLPAPHAEIRALPGPEFDEFAPQSRELFWQTEWTLTAQSNRMGGRLAGPVLARTTDRELRSHAVVPGVVQVPPNGQPIVLQADAQTTGGYPRMAVVIQADLWRLAQVPLGGRLRFVRIDRAEAHAAWQLRQAYLRRIEVALGGH